jgi:hypothetical protein
MKISNCYIIIYFPLLAFACKKETIKSEGSASLNIVNVVNGTNSLVTNFTTPDAKGNQPPLQSFGKANQVWYSSYSVSSSYIGETYLSLSQMPDTLSTVWKGSFDLAAGSIYTFFLSGDTSNVDTLFTTDIIPYYPMGDSVAGVRFINLIQGSMPMSVNIQGNPSTQTEFSGLGYRQISAFKSYSANSNIGGTYNFEIRDQYTDSLLQTFPWNYTLRKNQTIVICGQEGASSAYPITVFPMNNY